MNSDTTPSQEKNKFSAWELLAVLSIGVFPHLFDALKTRSNSQDSDYSQTQSMMDLFVYSVLKIIPILYIMHRSGVGMRAFGVRPFAYYAVPLGALVAFVLYRWDSWVLLQYYPAPAPESETGKPSWNAIPGVSRGYVFWVFMGNIANAMAEELVCRAYLITRLIHWLKSPTAALVISTFVFFSYHLYYQHNVTLALILESGVVLGLMFLLTRNLWPCVFCHFFYNILYHSRVAEYYSQ